MNQRFLMPVIGFGVASAIALGCAVMITMGSTALVEPGVFPSLPTTRAELHDGETIRSVELYPDGVTPRRGTAVSVDDSETRFEYRPDGTLARVTTMSAPDEKGERRLMRFAEIAEDGKTYAYDVEYFPSGTTAKETRLVDPANTHRSYFFEDGSVRRTQVIALDSKGWKLVTEDIFREDQTLAHTLRSAEHGAYEKTWYAEDGVRVTTVNKFVPGRYIEYTLSADGETKLREVYQDYNGTRITTRRENGVVEKTRSWTSEVGKGSMIVEVMDESGTLIYDNWWILRDGNYTLWMHREYRPDGTNSRQLIFRDDSTTVETELVYTGDGRKIADSFIRRKYRPDGTLATEEDVEKYKTVAERQFTPEDNRRALVDPERLLDGEYTAPPTVVPYVPPMSEH